MAEVGPATSAEQTHHLTPLPPRPAEIGVTTQAETTALTALRALARLKTTGACRRPDGHRTPPHSPNKARRTGNLTEPAPTPTGGTPGAPPGRRGTSWWGCVGERMEPTDIQDAIEEGIRAVLKRLVLVRKKPYWPELIGDLLRLADPDAADRLAKESVPKGRGLAHSVITACAYIQMARRYARPPWQRMDLALEMLLQAHYWVGRANGLEENGRAKREAVTAGAKAKAKGDRMLARFARKLAEPHMRLASTKAGRLAERHRADVVRAIWPELQRLKAALRGAGIHTSNLSSGARSERIVRGWLSDDKTTDDQISMLEVCLSHKHAPHGDG